jgi:hypothetical protein
MRRSSVRRMIQQRVRRSRWMAAIGVAGVLDPCHTERILQRLTSACAVSVEGDREAQSEQSGHLCHPEVGLFACWVPALRAARVDPAITMRAS